ncbi:hypothetical protein GGI03_006451 [Coemansia sp. RSA 2337]|nr:hypothetical protein H4S03_008102 [Coemansia sp. S3946]KAJ2118281.1 hypothetical protein IW146_000061 [Coemansia sp. RSA 922]KAJ2455677.1 hypothetical protein GGI03_006451 [Coemansia sp. RSA 2337]
MRDSLTVPSGPSRQQRSVAPVVGAGRSASHGPASRSPNNTPRTRFAETEAETTSRCPALTDSDSGGCVPAHRSVFRLFRRRALLHRRSQSSASHEAAAFHARANTTTDFTGSASTNSSSSDHAGYLRSRRTTRAMTLSAQRTRSELAVVGPPPPAALAPTNLTHTRSQAEASSSGVGRSQPPRLHKADKGTIVQLRSSPQCRVVIPQLEGLHADIEAAVVTSTTNYVTDDDDTGTSANPRPQFVHRRSTSSVDVSIIIKNMESGVQEEEEDVEVRQRQLLHTVSDDELLTTNANVEVHVLPDDSSDWNSDFSSPSSWRRSTDRPVSKKVSRLIDGSRLKDRAIDRGVLDAQHRILQQEKYLVQISNLSFALAKLRPLILRCLVFELPDRGIQISTSTFVSAIREPRGSIEPSIEEERLWELWRQAEALLTIMDNDSVPLSNVESRLTLSKKRAIMLAFCDWEQYSLYVQDAWDKARKGIQQPHSDRDSRRSSIQSNITYRTSCMSNRDSNCNSNSDGGALAKFSLSTQRKSRRRSVVGVAPASLQRIADEAQTIREECEQLLILMSPLYRESQLSPRVHTMTLASSPPPLPGPTPPLTTERVAVSAVGIAVDDTPTAPSVSLDIDAPTAVSDAKP